VTSPSRATVAGRTYRDIQNKARRDQRPTDELLSLYALEGFLDRLASSERKEQFVLKGGVLLAAYDLRRPTKDIDFQARSIEAEQGVILDIIAAVASTPKDDGLLFDVGTARAESIRDEEQYSGVRVTIIFNVDVNVGDPISPSPSLLTLPRLLGGSISVRGYPATMIHAEKIVTALQRGIGNTRWRDFADIYMLSGKHSVSATELKRSLTVVADHRETVLRPLSLALEGYAELGETRWRAWVRKQQIGEAVPAEFKEVLAEVFKFADPSLRGELKDHLWSPDQRQWTAL
jgi:hypothetical protein